MQLHSRIIGSGSPLVILHGLFGMSDNWLTIGNELASHGFEVHLLDLRNHGRSPHAPSHTYKDMSEDVLHYFDTRNIERGALIGHSMGGKLAMYFALLHPEKLSHLAVIDIAPSDYSRHNPGYHLNIIHNLMAVDLGKHKRRSTLIADITERLHDHRLGMFLGKSIQRDEKGNFYWRLNLPVLLGSLPGIVKGFDELRYLGPGKVPTLFVRGEKSDYIQSKHEVDRVQFFPESEVETIAGGGHWLHIEQPKRLVERLLRFIDCT